MMEFGCLITFLPMGNLFSYCIDMLIMQDALILLIIFTSEC